MWLQPYRNEADFGQFVAEMLHPKGDLCIDFPGDVIESINKVNSGLCHEMQREWATLDSNHQEGFEENESRLLRIKPTFEAVAVVLLQPLSRPWFVVRQHGVD